MLYKECSYCCFSNQCYIKSLPVSINSFVVQYRNFTPYFIYDPLIDDIKEYYYLEGVRAPQGEINRIVGLLAAREPNIFNELNNYGINRRTSIYLFRLIIGYVIDNEKKYSGNKVQKTNAILTEFESTYKSVLQTFLTIGVPRNRLSDIIRMVIRFALDNLRRAPTPPPTTPPLIARVTGRT